MPTERELKFSLMDDTFPDRDSLRLALSAAGYDLSAARENQQRDRYYDDAVFSLKTAGYALRRRSVNNNIIVTLKSKGNVQGALHERNELEVPALTHAWPQEIYDAIKTITNPQALRGHIDISTRRVTYLLYQQNQELAELAFDAVTASYPKSDQSIHFNELELEAKHDATAEQLTAIADVLDGVIALTANPVTKLERAEVLLSLGASFQQ